MKRSISNINAGIFFCLSVFFINFIQMYSQTKDTIDNIKPNEYHGLLLNDTNSTISKQDIQRINYSSMYDILNTRNELYGMSLGINGHYNNFLSYGSIDNNISFSFNDRPLNNYLNGKFNIENFSPEFFERMEFLSGSDAAILSSNPSNSYINIQEIIYNTKIPFTRLWYAQEGGSFIGADGIFSQNFSKDWNLTFGFKKIGDRLDFDNMSTDYWNLRTILRYNIDSSSSLSLSDNFTNNKTITNGGSNPEESFNIYSSINSVPYYQKIQLREYRHDLNLTYTKKINLFYLTNTLYFTNEINERVLPNFNNTDTSGITNNNTEIQIGNRINLDFNYKSIDFKVGSNINSYNSNGNKFFDSYSGINWNIYSRAALQIADNVGLSGGINYGNNSNNKFIGFGEKLKIKSDNLLLYFDHSFISKNGLVIYENLKNENTNLFIAGFDIENKIKIEGYFRVSQNPIYYELINDYITKQINFSDYQSYGGSLSYNNLIYSNLFDSKDKINLFLQARINLIIGNTQLENYYSPFTIYGGLNYKLMVNQSELNLGLKGGLLGSKKAPRFIPISNSYIITDNKVGTQTTGLSVYSTMKLGNAFVKIEWENILNANYYNVSYYPERAQVVKLSVAWSFFD